ncbi:MAG: hypothetical protein IJJ85_01680 [Clostridia bacterium]|nr:hypothetical protein [Clostridia bacterium]
MKSRVIVGALCLVLAFLTAFYGYRRVGRASEALAAAAETAVSAADDGFEGSARQALRLWDENRAVFFAFVRRDTAEAADVRFEIVRRAILQSDPARARDAFSELAAMFRTLPRTEKPGFENIL